ncbi:unnamed protein product [Effrenium voratum]|nr:unnamed protein product [Effrenium voratum]
MMSYSYCLMMSEWNKVEEQEQRLFCWLGGSLPLPPALLKLVGCAHPPRPSLPSANYRKLAKLLEALETNASTADAMMGTMECFGAGVGQWLKIAGDGKAHLLEAVLARFPGGVALELGSFVGYTALRLGRALAQSVPGVPFRGFLTGEAALSIEVDPIHGLFTRHCLMLAGLSSEVWLGHSSDLIPRLAEEFGDRLGLVFMDHRGTRFHSDLQLLEGHELLMPWAGATQLVFDNTLKPGSPRLLWLLTHALQPLQVASWALDEFAHWNSEDWMTVATRCPPKKDSPISRWASKIFMGWQPSRHLT